MQKIMCLIILGLGLLAGRANAQAPTLLSPLSGSFSSAPTFKFHVNATGCYIIVVSNSSSHCSTNGSGSDWVFSFGALSPGDYMQTIPTGNWNALSSGPVHWHISYNLFAPCSPPYITPSSCAMITKN